MVDWIAASIDRPAATGIFVDFDGTLAEIVARPEQAVAQPPAPSLLRRLAQRYALVAVISGRTSRQLNELIGEPGLVLHGLYGLEAGPAVAAPARRSMPEVHAVARRVDGAWVEDKGASIAVHYRAAPDPEAARRALAPSLAAVAARGGLRLIEGKMVIELAPPETPGKGAVVLQEVRARGLRRCLYAGDDVADLAAFAALDGLRTDGVDTLKVAVRSEETPAELLGTADLVVERPAGLVKLLSDLLPDG